MNREREAEGLKYGFSGSVKAAETLEFSRPGLGQRNPQHCPYPAEAASTTEVRPQPLGEPLTIHDVAELLGCSAWTVRQRYLREGLPHLQARPRGKLVFFREQVISWTLKRQLQKGGLIR
jgi:hypothetical protein